MNIQSQDHIEILALYAEYNRALDAGDVEAWVATFLKDGVFFHPARAYAGGVELREFVTKRSAQFASNPIADLMHWNDPIRLSGNHDHAKGSCRLLVAGIDRESGKPEIAARGQYVDSLVRTATGWRFQERRLIPS